MLLDPDTENDVAYELCQLLGRAILPIRRAGGVDAAGTGTAFFFRTIDGEQAREYLLTADELTGAPGGEIGLRPSVTEPTGVAPETLPVPDVPGAWLHLPEVGVAVLPTAGLHEYARSQGWRWRVHQVPDGIAAGPGTIARIGPEPTSALVLALGVARDGSRPLEVAVERVARAGDSLRISTELPAGYAGAPVFSVAQGTDGTVGLRCLGLVLPGPGGHRLATFDRIRAALTAAVGDT